MYVIICIWGVVILFGNVYDEIYIYCNNIYVWGLFIIYVFVLVILV